MPKKLALWFIGFILFRAMGHCFAADMNVQLTTTDGSTKFSIQNSAAADVASVDSLGNATFTKVTQTGSGGTFILNQNTLQSGSTFYISSGTVNRFTVGTSITLPSGALPDAALASTPASANTNNAIVKRDGSGNFSAGIVSAALNGNATTATTATHLTGGANGSLPYQTGSGVTTMLAAGSNGQVIQQAGGIPTWTNLTNSDVSNVINLQSALQTGATFYVSSGTVSGPLRVGGILVAGTGATPITTTAGLLDATKLNGNLPALNGSALTNLSGPNVVGNIPGNAVSLTGTINPNQLNAGSLAGTVIASSIAISAVQDASIVTLSASKLTGIINNAAVDSSSITKQGNAFNAANQLVALDASGNMTLPASASISVGSVRGSILPSGTLILTTSTCPSGFTEYTAAGGYYLVGVPSGGTAAGVIGSAMGNLSNTAHNHTVTSTTANLLGGLTAAVTSVTSPTGDVMRGAIAPYFQIRLCSVP